jgi:plasmid stabilization system protein ParE
MERRLRLTGPAKRGLKSISQYISTRFGHARAQKYVADVRAHIQLIQNNPTLFMRVEVAPGQFIHKSIFQNKTVLLYSFTDDQVLIKAISDTRTNWSQDKGV